MVPGDCEIKMMEDEESLARHGQDLADLMVAGFSWILSPEGFSLFWREDPRMRGGPLGAYAVDHQGRMRGFVGMARRTYLAQGREVETGHFWGVVVRSDHARRGIARALMERALEWFDEMGTEAVTLYSTTGLVAYPLYQSLGFRDHHHKAFWRSPPLKVGSGPALRTLQDAEVLRVAEIYSRHLEGHEGYSRREANVLLHNDMFGKIGPDWYMTIDPPGSLEGYVCMQPKPLRGLTYVLEIVGPDSEWYSQATLAVRAALECSSVLLSHRNPAARSIFEEHGFSWCNIGHHELMMNRGDAVAPDHEAASGGPGILAESRYDIF
jgi:GNAT superfamily N-acetyltransferase